MQRLIQMDFTRESASTIESSYGLFQTLLLTHSVERSPKSAGIFSPANVNAIIDFVAHSYYRHFQLYKCIFTPFFHAHFIQKHVGGTQIPARPRPLSEAFLHPTEVSLSASSCDGSSAPHFASAEHEL